jgi:hypothetical protein
MKQSRLAWPSPLRNSRASASVVERCVSFERFSPWKSRSPLRPGAGGVPEPSFGRKLFRLAQAWISVPSTEEVLVRKQPFDLRVVEHGGEELRRDLAAQQPVAVLGEYGDIPNRIVDAEADEPARDFVVHWGVIPDLAMDLTVPWLVAFMPVEQATHLFLGIARRPRAGLARGCRRPRSRRSAWTTDPVSASPHARLPRRP